MDSKRESSAEPVIQQSETYQSDLSKAINKVISVPRDSLEHRLREKVNAELNPSRDNSKERVRETEKLVGKIKKRFISGKDGQRVSDENEKDPNIVLLERELNTLLGLKVEINHKTNNTGNLAIFYKSIDQIQPVLDKLKWKPK